MVTPPRLFRRVPWASARLAIAAPDTRATKWPAHGWTVACWLLIGPVLLAGTLLAAQIVDVPHRVFDTSKNRVSDVDAMLDDITRADVVFVGEQHTHADTHRLERAMLDGLARRKRGVIVALEMFERDAQEPLDHFQIGHLSEADFLAAVRPWRRYASDYKPLVDFAIQQNWPVVAANVPEALAAQVARQGLGVLETKPEAEKSLFAREIRCPITGPDFTRFKAAIQHDHPASGSEAGAVLDVERVYLAQCLRDETMGESIAQVLTAGGGSGKPPLVVSVNGAFHSDFGDGVVARVRRRLPEKRLLVVSIQPVGSLDAIAPDAEERRRADYLVYVLAPKP